MERGIMLMWHLAGRCIIVMHHLVDDVNHLHAPLESFFQTFNMISYVIKISECCRESWSKFTTQKPIYKAILPLFKTGASMLSLISISFNAGKVPQPPISQFLEAFSLYFIHLLNFIFNGGRGKRLSCLYISKGSSIINWRKQHPRGHHQRFASWYCDIGGCIGP